MKFGEYSNSPKLFGSDEIIHSYRSVINPKDLENFMSSLGSRYEGSFPNMYAVALSAPALMSLGAERGFIGLHASQSFDVHGDFHEGPVEVVIGNEDIRKGSMGALHRFDQQWIQDDQIKASGKALVAPLDPASVQSPSRLKDLIVDAAYSCGLNKLYQMSNFYKKSE